jgi:hypothetical protein
VIRRLGGQRVLAREVVKKAPFDTPAAAQISSTLVAARPFCRISPKAASIRLSRVLGFAVRAMDHLLANTYQPVGIYVKPRR